MTRYFEDFEVGDVEEFGSYTVTEAEIVEFAEQYDPQWFHTDPGRATESMYGGLIASGWHTASVTMRMLVDGMLSKSASLGAKGVDELRWPRPVRPGDTLSVRTEVLEKEAERPDRGVVVVRNETFNDDDERVFSMVSHAMFARRDADAE
jgi:acyl dehydratase